MGWDERLPIILKELQSCNSDVQCLQEMQVDCMEEDVLPALEAKYQGIRCDNKGKNKAIFAVATFWKSNRFTLHQVIHKSRIMISILRNCRNGQHLAVVNVHQEGHPSQTMKRVLQLQGAIKVLQNCGNIDAIVVGDDFNCV